MSLRKVPIQSGYFEYFLHCERVKKDDESDGAVGMDIFIRNLLIIGAILLLWRIFFRAKKTPENDKAPERKYTDEELKTMPFEKWRDFCVETARDTETKVLQVHLLQYEDLKKRIEEKHPQTIELLDERGIRQSLASLEITREELRRRNALSDFDRETVSEDLKEATLTFRVVHGIKESYPFHEIQNDGGRFFYIAFVNHCVNGALAAEGVEPNDTNLTLVYEEEARMFDSTDAMGHGKVIVEKTMTTESGKLGIKQAERFMEQHSFKNGTPS